MPDPRFFSVAGPFSLQEVAEISRAELGKGADPEIVISDVASLDAAGPGEIGFLDNKLHLSLFTESRAGVCLVDPGLASKAPSHMTLLLTKEPHHGFARVAEAFYPEPAPEPATAPTVCVSDRAAIGEGCRIETGVVIGAGAEIGRRCRIGANTVIGGGVVLGDDCRIGPLVTLSYLIAGSRVIIHPGVRIGQDGFGFALGEKQHIKVPQLGRVRIGDDVEIGANTTIDRGAASDTVIGDGCKIDNLVQIGHNVRLGRNCMIVSQVGISGSTILGDSVMLGGQAGLAGHLRVGDGARVAAQGGVMRDIDAGTTVGGFPAVPMREWMRSVAAIKRMIKKQGG
ncbi:MAG TPA: UDP-3-O-(3-hydroxymyristoyl)glucosamine N-acyltransferase [Rhodospirillaceae bacterium]|nr:UDP-3-O-(3-hydroxymyristoyl)glucosamine N-acyltransferase [Rhodospirillaceae bacterium]